VLVRQKTGTNKTRKEKKLFAWVNVLKAKDRKKAR
jgi:hypothetical protein